MGVAVPEPMVYGIRILNLNGLTPLGSSVCSEEEDSLPTTQGLPRRTPFRAGTRSPSQALPLPALLSPDAPGQHRGSLWPIACGVPTKSSPRGITRCAEDTEVTVEGPICTWEAGWMAAGGPKVGPLHGSPVLGGRGSLHPEGTALHFTEKGFPAQRGVSCGATVVADTCGRCWRREAGVPRVRVLGQARPHHAFSAAPAF